MRPTNVPRVPQIDRRGNRLVSYDFVDGIIGKPIRNGVCLDRQTFRMGRELKAEDNEKKEERFIQEGWEHPLPVS